MDTDKTPHNPVGDIKIVLGIPKDGATPPAAYDNRLEMAFHLGMVETMSAVGLTQLEDLKLDIPENVRFRFIQITTGRVFTALARERIAEEAVSCGADYLFMIDDDMIAPPDIFEKLYKHNVDIVAALAFNRYPPHKPVCYQVKEGYDPVEKKQFFANYPIIDYPRNELVQCDAVGFGAVLIKTSVLKALKKPWFMVMTGAGEDINFCWKAGKAGFKIFMDTSLKLGHLSDPVNITEDTFDTEANALAIKGEMNANK